MTVGGLVLCGGASRRMGTPKALLDWCGRPLLVHMLDILRGARLAPLAVSAGPDQVLPALPDDVLIFRDPVEHSGPLQGLATGLSGLAPFVSRAFVCGCDAPLLSRELIELLASRGAPLVVPEVDGVPQLLLGMFDTALGATARSLLERGLERVFDLLEDVEAEVVSGAQICLVDPGLGSFLNCNDQESYARAKWLAARTD